MSSSSDLPLPSTPGNAGGAMDSSPLTLGTPGGTPMTPLTPRSSVASMNLPRSDLGSSHHRAPRASQHTPMRSSTGINSSSTPMRAPGSTDEGNNSGSSNNNVPSSSQPTYETLIWGTNINVQDTSDKFRRFFMEYTREGDDEPLYPRMLWQMKETETYQLNLDCHNVNAWDQSLYTQIIRFPQEVIPIMDLVIHDLFKEAFPDHQLLKRIQVRTFNLADKRSMRDLNPTDIDQMVSLRGMITRLSPIIPDMKQALFQCATCNFTTTVFIDRGRIEEPERCTHCSAQRSFQIVHNRCLFADKQIIKLQESPENIPEGETPFTVSLCVFDELVDSCRPGDRVEITGIFRAMASRTNPRMRTLQAIYRTYVDVIHLRRSDVRRFDADVEDILEGENGVGEDVNVGELQESIATREQHLRTLAADPQIYDRLVASVAPSIFELDDVKKGLLCLLFSGTTKEVRSSTNTNASGSVNVPNGSGRYRLRGEINVLLVGDPAVSKSQLLGYTHQLAPRGVYTSGKGSSAVGLTAYVTRDPDTREIVLESGALVLSDRGVCCIDEFDKMSDATRAILHEAMEQQTVSIAKSGIVASLQARTSILASANPRGSRYNPQESVIENIQLPPTLLSRFDLIYLVLDKTNPDSDRRLARHIVGLYHRRNESAENRNRAPIDMKTLTQYISYAKKNVHPVITDEVVEDLVQGYVSMRLLGTSRRTITATPRQLESLIRISEALAKMRLSNRVERRDVQEAIRLVRVAMQQSAVDPRTGTIDMDLISTGRSASERVWLMEVTQKMRQVLLEAPERSVTLKVLARRLEELHRMDVTLNDLTDAANELDPDEFLYNARAGRIQKRAV